MYDENNFQFYSFHLLLPFKIIVTEAESSLYSSLSISSFKSFAELIFSVVIGFIELIDEMLVSSVDELLTYFFIDFFLFEIFKVFLSSSDVSSSGF